MRTIPIVHPIHISYDVIVELTQLKGVMRVEHMTYKICSHKELHWAGELIHDAH